MDSTVILAHERLAAYRRACEFAAATAQVLRGLPRGEASLADQLRRAGDSVVLNLAEGAGRIAPREKARFYEIALGSGAECGAAHPTPATNAAHTSAARLMAHLQGPPWPVLQDD